MMIMQLGGRADPALGRQRAPRGAREEQGRPSTIV